MINERKLTERELESRESVLKGLLSNKRNLVKKYGKDAEKVMYGIATKKAKSKVEGMNKSKIKELIQLALEGVDSSPRSNTDDINIDKSYSSGADYGSETSANTAEDDMEVGELKEGHGLEQKDLNVLKLLVSAGEDDYLSDDEVEILKFIIKSNILQDKTKDLSLKESKGAKNYFDDLKYYYTKTLPYLDKDEKEEYKQLAKNFFSKLQEGLDEDYKPSLRAYNVIDKESGEIIDNDLPKHMALKLANKKKGWVISPTDSLAEDLDLGHEDNEPHMLKADLYRIGKYAMDLYQMMDELEGQGEVDLPHWWQAKITNAKTGIVGAKHYLDFEIKEPAIDAVVDRMDDIAPEMEIDVVDDIEIEEELFTPNEIGDEAIDRESASGAFESIAEKLAKQLKSKQPIKKVTEGFKVGDKVTMKGGGKEMEITNSRKMIGSKLNAYSVKKSNGKTAEYDESQLKLSKQDKPVKENMVADKDIEKEIKKLKDENPKGFEKEIKKLKVRQAALKLSK